MAMIPLGAHAWQIPITRREGINCFLLGDVLVDAGIRSSGPKLLAAVQDRPLAAHVLTHAHADHQGATHQICMQRDIPLWCHAAEKDAVEAGRVTDSLKHPDGWLARFQQRRIAGPGHPVARTLAEGDAVADFEVVETPGHTKGHISLWRAADGLLIAGDAAVGMHLITTIPRLGLPFAMASWDMDQVRQSIRKLAALSPTCVAFGHGPKVSGADFMAFAAALP